jgi:hypothetical protein
VPEQVVLEYGGFSLARGRCHVVFDLEHSQALVGEPLDNPGTAVTNAIEEVAFSLKTSLGLDVSAGQLFQYAPWDLEVRRERTVLVKFHGDAWSMPVWTDATDADPFLIEALAEVHAIKPYTLAAMSHLKLVLSIVRVRVDAAGVPAAHLRLDDVGTVEHISQRRFYYLDVRAPTEEAAISAVHQALGGDVGIDRIQVTTPNAPLDQPGSLPV